jgi:hypothetical protein
MMPHPAHRTPEHVHWRQFDSELVVLDMKAGAYFGLSEVAAAAFERLAKGSPTSEVVADLLNIYDVDRARLESDIDALLETLLRRGLLVASGDSAAKDP